MNDDDDKTAELSLREMSPPESGRYHLEQMRHVRPLKVIHRLEDIPAFRDEAEEHAFWAEHEFSDELWESAQLLEPGELPEPRQKSIVGKDSR